MEKVATVKQFSALTELVKSKHGNYVYNTMLMPTQINEFLAEGKLYFIQQEEGILFLCDEKDFYKGYFYCKDDELPVQLDKLDKPLIIEFLFTARAVSQVVRMEDKIKHGSFDFYVENIRTTVQLDQTELSGGHLNHTALWAGSQEKEQIYRLWKELDQYDSIIPREEAYEKMTENRELLCLKQNQRVCAVLRLKEENKNTASIWLVVVDPSRQGSGLGRTLYQAAISKGKERGYRRIWQWADRKNQRVLKTVNRLGFTFDGTVSREYILMK